MKAKTAKKPKSVIHIEERLSFDYRGLCYAKMDFYGNTYKTNMTTKMSESTCPKCIEIRKKRVAQAVETRAFRKAYRQRLIDEAKAEVDEAKAIAEAMKTEEVDFAVRYSGTGSDGKHRSITESENRDATVSVADVQMAIEEDFMNGNSDDRELGLNEVEDIMVLSRLNPLTFDEEYMRDADPDDDCDAPCTPEDAKSSCDCRWCECYRMNADPDCPVANAGHPYRYQE